ncbi:MAG: glycosyltransferase [Sulfurovum sp.]|nr:glycosyltransferase [Sulfurovum sp.]MDD3602258.1 glycosyltransferase [Sulfurovum sp.]
MKFSVLISVYHKEKPDFLDQALSSIENQTLKADEIVLVKDGPLTNELDEVIKKHQLVSHVPYTIVVLDKNVGLGTALNKGLERCQYEWVARMDSDDIALPERFEKQISFLESHPEVDILGSSILEFDTDTKMSIGERRLPLKHDQIMQYAKLRNPLNHMTVMFRKSAIESVGNYLPMNGFEDYYLWVRLLQRGFRFANLDEVLVKARAGDEMILRRHGWSYVKNEWRFVQCVKNLGFLSFLEYIRYLATRIPLRLLPPFILKKMYNILRKN